MNKKPSFIKTVVFSQYILIILGWACFGNATFAQPNNCNGCVPISVTRLSKPTTPVIPEEVPLIAPVFESSTRAVPLGSSLKILAPNAPAGAILEYSKDNGNTWITGNEVVIDGKIDIVARVRLNQSTSALLSGSFVVYYQRMLVIGNSIMFHGPAPDLGWTNANGMAASAPEKDFVHLLTAQLKTLNPATTTQLQAGTGFELNFGKPTYNMDEFDQTMQTFKPDLIIVRLGENVADGDVPVRNFEGQFRQLIDRLVSLSQGQPVKIVTTTSVWEKPQTDAVIRKVIAEKGLTLVDLSSMVGQSQYFAGGYANPGVAAHPGDLGMQRITDLIWEKVQ